MTEDVEVVKAVCNAWSQAIDSVMREAKKYDEARENYRRIIPDITLRRIQQAEIASQEKKSGNPTLAEEFKREYEEITDAQRALKEKIDTVNTIKFRY